MQASLYLDGYLWVSTTISFDTITSRRIVTDWGTSLIIPLYATATLQFEIIITMADDSTNLGAKATLIFKAVETVVL